MRKLLLFICLAICVCLPIPTVSAASGDDAEGRKPAYLEKMIPAFDSVIRAMMDDEMEYDPSNPEFFWTTIYMLAVNFTDYDSAEVFYDDNGYEYELSLSALAVRELAIALFKDYDGILPIPDSLHSYLVRYDEDLNVYRFPLSDAGDAHTVIDSSELSLHNFTYVVFVRLVSYGEEETILSAKIEIVPNTDAGDIVGRYYPYSIVSAEIVE